MSARKVGKNVGKAAGWIGNTLWNSTVIIATSVGEAGEGFIEGAEEGWGERDAVMQAYIARKAAARSAAKAEFLAYKAAKEVNNAAPLVAAVA